MDYLTINNSQYSDWLQTGRLRARSLSPSGGKNYHFFMLSGLAPGLTQPLIQWVLGSFSLGVKWLGHEADHSPPTSAEGKKTWIYTSIPIRLHGIVLN
jgi:hypothetical protein